MDLTRITMLLLYITIASLTSGGVAYPQVTSEPVAGDAKSEERLHPDRKHEETVRPSVPQTPVDVFMHVIELLKTGDRKKILEQADPYVTRDSKEWLKKVTDQDATGVQRWATDIQAHDGKIFGDLAIIVKYRFILYTRNDQPVDWEGVDLDTDPFILHRVDGIWKVLLSEMEDLHSYMSSRKLNARLSESMSWYQANEQSIRTNLQRDQKNAVSLIKSRYKPSANAGTLAGTFVHEKDGAEYLWLVIEAKDGQHLADAVYLYSSKAVELAEKSNLKGSPLVEVNENSPHRGNIVFFIREPSEPKTGFYRATTIDELKRIQLLSFYEFDKIHSRRSLWDIGEKLPEHTQLTK